MVFTPVVFTASTQYCSRVERISEHIPMVIFVSSCVESLMFDISSVFPREELRCIIGLCRRYFRYFLALMYHITREPGVPAV